MKFLTVCTVLCQSNANESANFVFCTREVTFKVRAKTRTFHLRHLPRFVFATKHEKHLYTDFCSKVRFKKTKEILRDMLGLLVISWRQNVSDALVKRIPISQLAVFSPPLYILDEHPATDWLPEDIPEPLSTSWAKLLFRKMCDPTDPLLLKSRIKLDMVWCYSGLQI